MTSSICCLKDSQAGLYRNTLWFVKQIYLWNVAPYLIVFWNTQEEVIIYSNPYWRIPSKTNGNDGIYSFCTSNVHQLEKFKVCKSSIKVKQCYLWQNKRFLLCCHTMPANMEFFWMHYQNLLLLYKWNANFSTWGEPDQEKPHSLQPAVKGLLIWFLPWAFWL